jgi:hypothetical protein
VVTSLTLDAARRVTAELGERISVDKHLLVPAYDSVYRTWPLDCMYVDTPRSDASTNLICIPGGHKYRLGALPLLARQVAHVVARRYQNHNPVFEIATSILKMPEVSDQSRRMTSLFSSIEISKKDTQFRLDETEELINRLYIASEWSMEIFCDLLATALVGPSYVYALSRFATGTFAEFSAEARQYVSYPPMPDRVCLCLDFLKSMKITTVFTSRYLLWEYEPLPDKIVSGVLDKIARPYSVMDHERATSVIKKELQNGNTVDETAILILNALWDAVVKKEGYVNEIAALVSVAGRRGKPM